MIYWIFNQFHFFKHRSCNFITELTVLCFVELDYRNNLKSKFQFFLYWSGGGFSLYSSLRYNFIPTQFICNLYIRSFLQSNVIRWHFSIIWSCVTYPVGNTLTLLLILIQSFGVHWYQFCIFWLQNVQSVSNLLKFPPTFIFIPVFNCCIVWFSHFLDLDIWGYLCFEVPGTRTFAFPHTFCQ